MRILLVEDEPNAARMLAKGLREEAYAVDVAGDGEPNCPAGGLHARCVPAQRDHQLP